MVKSHIAPIFSIFHPDLRLSLANAKHEEIGKKTNSCVMYFDVMNVYISGALFLCILVLQLVSVDILSFCQISLQISGKKGTCTNTHTHFHHGQQFFSSLKHVQFFFSYIILVRPFKHFSCHIWYKKTKFIATIYLIMIRTCSSYILFYRVGGISLLHTTLITKSICYSIQLRYL